MPVEAATLCRPMPALDGDDVDALSIWSGDMIDAYVECALRHKALRDWARGD